ncbi:hypothetical protein EOM82_09785 [bacterium]|nr:hypothetical protein [bacterium]
MFGSKSHELEEIKKEIDINLQNNYKSVAHEKRKLLGVRAEELYQAGKIKEKDYKKYIRIYDEYTEMMKDYHH